MMETKLHIWHWMINTFATHIQPCLKKCQNYTVPPIKAKCAYIHIINVSSFNFDNINKKMSLARIQVSGCASETLYKTIAFLSLNRLRRKCAEHC